MRNLVCPHCGLEVKTAPGGEEVENCPRCLARSGGALSVYLSNAEREQSRRRGVIAGRLLRLQRGDQWART
jgi:hypothetical protein